VEESKLEEPQPLKVDTPKKEEPAMN